MKGWSFTSLFKGCLRWYFRPTFETQKSGLQKVFRDVLVLSLHLSSVWYLLLPLCCTVQVMHTQGYSVGNNGSTWNYTGALVRHGYHFHVPEICQPEVQLGEGLASNQTQWNGIVLWTIICCYIFFPAWINGFLCEAFIDWRFTGGKDLETKTLFVRLLIAGGRRGMEEVIYFFILFLFYCESMKRFNWQRFKFHSPG